MAQRQRLLIVLPVLIYLVLAAWFVRAPLRWDETDAPPQADAILRHGFPRIPESETNLLSHPASVNGSKYGDVDFGLWHPPTYLYLEAGTRAVLGKTDVANRLLNLALGTAGVVAVMWATRRQAKRRMWSGERVDFVTLLSGVLIASCPFWLSGTMRVDIDGALLSLVEVVALATAFSRDPAGRLMVRQTPVAVGAFALLWAKPPGFFLVMLGLAALLIWSRRWLQLARLVTAAAIGAAAFAGSWMLFARGGDLPWRFPLDFTYLHKGAPSLSLSVAANIARYNVGFIGWSLVLLSAMAFVTRAGPARREPLPSDAFFFVAMVSAGYYTFGWNSAGKYTVPLVAVAVVGSVITIADRFPLEEWSADFMRRPTRAAAWFAVMLAVGYLAGDAITAEAGDLVAFSLKAGISDRRLVAIVASALALGMVTLVMWRKHRTLPRALVSACLLFAVPAGLAQHSFVLRNAKTTLVLSPSDERGFMEAIDWIDAHVERATVVLTYKEVAYHSRLGGSCRSIVLSTSRQIKSEIGSTRARFRLRFCGNQTAEPTNHFIVRTRRTDRRPFCVQAV